MGPDPRDPGPLALHVPRLVREWASDPLAAGRLHRALPGSIVLADLSGFTKLSERLARQGRAGSEAIAGIIDRCFTALIDEAYGYGGTLLQFSGDAVLLLFRRAGHERAAAGAALAMRDGLRVTRNDLPVVGSAPLSMTVGVHSGTFDFFLVGASHRQLVVGGPAATRLVELEEAASRGRILVSEETGAAVPAANLGVAEHSGIRLRGQLAPSSPTEVDFLDVGLDMAPYVAAEIRAAVSDGDVHAEHRTATVAFVEYGKLDDVLAAHGPDEAAARLDALMGGVQAAIDPRMVCFQSADVGKNGGKFFLSVGAPRSTGADEEAMLLALREIVELDVGLPVRAGVNSGPVFMGEIRTQHRRTFITMGDTVNLAARVMGKSEPGTVLATHPVLDRSRTLFVETRREPFMVKGKARPVEATVVGHAQGVRPGIAATDLPTVGRDEELAAYADVEAVVQGGSGRYVELIADAGAGKSRLLDEFELHDPDFAFHRVRCRLYQSATPYFAAGELLRAVVGLAARPHEQWPAYLRTLADRARVTGDLALLGTAFGVEVDGEVPDDPEVRKARLQWAVVAVLETVLTEPVTMCVEDAHWIDDPSRDLLAAIAARLEDHPWLLVSAHRRSGGQIDATPDLVLDLQPLRPSALTALVRAATTEAPLAPHVVDTLVERSGGNPLFLLEMVNGLRCGDDLTSMPTSVEGLLTARIDRLATADRALLRHAAVLGNEFDMRYVDDVLPASVQAEPEQALLRLTEFVAISEQGWVSFHHHLVRDVAYGGLPYRTRRQLHAAVAESVRARVGDDVEEVAALLSLHYWHARRYSEAWDFSVLAADQAAEVYANVEAVEMYQRALRAASQLELADAELVDALEKLGDAQRLAGLTEEARASYTRARRLATGDAVARARLWLKTAYLDDRLGRPGAALRAVRRGVAEVLEDPSRDARRTLARLVGWEAAVRIGQGRLRDAVAASRRAIALAEPVGDRATAARASLTLDFALAALGEHTDFDGSRRALETYADLGDLAGEASAANTLGGYAFFAGDLTAAAELYHRSRAARERMGDPSGMALADANLAEVLIEEGDLAAADALLDDALAVWRATKDIGDVPFALQLKGTLARRRGDVAAARALLVEAREAYTVAGALDDAAEVDTALAGLSGG